MVMSYVANYILKVGCCEADVDLNSAHLGLIFRQVDQFTGGPKDFEADLYLATTNGRDVDEVITKFKKLIWQSPEDVQLMVQDQEEDRFTIHLPEGQDEESKD